MVWNFANYFELLSCIYYHGEEVRTRGLMTKELTNVTLDLNGWNFIWTEQHRPKLQLLSYLYPEMAWYLSGDRGISAILPFSKFWGSIRNPDNTINSNYGDLVFYRTNKYGITSFNWALDCLMKDKETRKAIILYNDRDLFFPENKDLICNQYQHMMIRNNKLNCVICLRSSDAIFGLTFNIPWWSFVHQYMHLCLLGKYPDLELGSMTAFISSSHIYENKYDLVKKMLYDEKCQEFLHLVAPPALNGTMDEYLKILPAIFHRR